MATCPRCGASLPDGTGDCPACREGSASPAIAVEEVSSGVDLRTRVVDDRGLIKKLQASVPGWREYRDKEDIRVADALLRGQLADRFARRILPAIEEARERSSGRLDLEAVREIGGLVGDARSTEACIRHAEQGYSGISAAYTVDAPALSRLYDYDYTLVSAVEQVERDAALARAAARGDDGSPPLADACRRVAVGLRGVRDLVQGRREMMARLGAYS